MSAPDRVPMIVQPGDAAYEARAAAEAAYWAEAHGFGIEAAAARGRPAETDHYSNERFTGDRDRPWYDEIARHGLFRRGLSIGASGIEQDARMLATNPALDLTICDISAGALDRWQRELQPRFGDRVHIQQADLNFADLPENAYDLIVSSSTIHHVTNLERLAMQINRALTPDGRFFLQDYCGENRYQFSARKKQVFELVYARDLARRPGRPSRLHWVTEEEGDFSPFCAIRSQDTLGVLAAYLDAQSVRTAGALIFPLVLVRPEGPAGPASRTARVRHRLRRRWLKARGHAAGRVDPVLFRELALAGDTLADAGELLPCNVFAIYGKRRTVG